MSAVTGLRVKQVFRAGKHGRLSVARTGIMPLGRIGWLFGFFLTKSTPRHTGSKRSFKHGTFRGCNGDGAGPARHAVRGV